MQIVNKELQNSGFVTWFDDDRLHGNVQTAMARGIERSRCALVFLTKEYQDKVNGKGPKGCIDNCYLEFRHIARKLTPERIIPVIMEEDMRDDQKWEEVLGINIGGRIYVDMSGNLRVPKYLSEKMEELKKNIRCILSDEDEVKRQNIQGIEREVKKLKLEEEEERELIERKKEIERQKVKEEEEKRKLLEREKEIERQKVKEEEEKRKLLEREKEIERQKLKEEEEKRKLLGKKLSVGVKEYEAEIKKLRDIKQQKSIKENKRELLERKWGFDVVAWETEFNKLRKKKMQKLKDEQERELLAVRKSIKK